MGCDASLDRVFSGAQGLHVPFWGRLKCFLPSNCHFCPSTPFPGPQPRGPLPGGSLEGRLDRLMGATPGEMQSLKFPLNFTFRAELGILPQSPAHGPLIICTRCVFSVPLKGGAFNDAIKKK